MRNAKTMVKRIRAGRAVIVPNDKVNKVINLFEEREAIRVEGSSLPDHSYILLKEAETCIHCNGKGFNGLDLCTQCN